MNDQIIQRPFVMLVSSCNPRRQRSTSLIHQDMDFAAQFSPVGGVRTGVTASQRRSTRTAVHRLPSPTDTLPATIKSYHRPENGLPDALLPPGLKTFMQNTTGNPKPTGVQRFPLAACSQHKPNTIQNRMVGFARTTWAVFLVLIGKVLFCYPPNRARYDPIFDVLRFCVMLFHDVSCEVKVLEEPYFTGIRPFLQPCSIFG
jgi:hypothetical protein